MSNLCQEFADFYFPSHPSGLGWIQNFPSNMRTFIPAGTVQWPRKLIHEFQSNSILDKRSDEPLGKHHFYPKFTFRNRVIHTFSDLYPDVCFVDSQIFHTLTPEDKLSEWAAHKVHLIIPVRGDIPNRFFDALITGGLPVVPRELEIVLDFFHIPRNFYSSYNLEDLITPKIIIDKALEKFDSEGKEGILERSYFCLNNFHVLINLHKMLKILLSDIHDTCN